MLLFFHLIRRRALLKGLCVGMWGQVQRHPCTAVFRLPDATELGKPRDAQSVVAYMSDRSPVTARSCDRNVIHGASFVRAERATLPQRLTTCEWWSDRTTVDGSMLLAR